MLAAKRTRTAIRKLLCCSSSALLSRPASATCTSATMCASRWEIPQYAPCWDVITSSGVAQALGSGIWPVMVLLSEVVQTFILADFWCVANVILNTIHLEIL